MLITLVTLGMLIAVGVAIVPRYGAFGVAMVAARGLSVLKQLCWTCVRLRLGIWTHAGWFRFAHCLPRYSVATSAACLPRAAESRRLMRNVLLLGAVGDNIGDEAIAVAAVRELRRLAPELNVTVSSYVERALAGLYDDVPEVYINRKKVASWLRLVRFIRSSDAVLIGGGSLIQDDMGMSLLRGMLPYVDQVTRLATVLRRPVMGFHLGVDELKTPRGHRMAGRILRRMQCITVRDSRSAELARQYGGPACDPVLSADPAICLQPTPRESADWAAVSDRRPYVALSLVAETLNSDHFELAIRAAIEHVLSTTSLDVRCVPMHRQEREELHVFRRLIEGLADRYPGRMHIEDPALSSVHMMNILRNARLLIAMRLHAMLLSVGYVPIVAISRGTKTDTLTRDFRLPSFDVRIGVRPDDLVGAVSTLLGQQTPDLSWALEFRHRSAELVRTGLKYIVGRAQAARGMGTVVPTARSL